MVNIAVFLYARSTVHRSINTNMFYYLLQHQKVSSHGTYIELL